MESLEKEKYARQSEEVADSFFCNAEFFLHHRKIVIDSEVKTFAGHVFRHPLVNTVVSHLQHQVSGMAGTKSTPPASR